MANFKNFAFSELAAGISDTDTTIILKNGDGSLFPIAYFQCVIYSRKKDSAAKDTNREIIKVTSITDDILTILRGREGTTAKNWLAGDKIYNTLTAEELNGIVYDGDDATLNTLNLTDNLLLSNNKNIQTDEIRARSSAGIKLFDIGGNGLFVKQGGNVGIGDNNPQDKLSVAGVNTITSSVSNTTNGIKVTTQVDDDRGYLGTASNHDLRIITNNIAKIAILTNGNIGIGTNAPEQILDVNAGSGNMIADGYDSHSLSKYKENIIDKDTTGFINKIKSFKLKEYTKKPFVSTEELVKLAKVKYNLENIKDARLYLDSLDVNDPIKIWIDNKKLELQEERRGLSEYQKKHLGLVVDDTDTVNALGDIINRDDNDNPKSYSLNNYVGFLHGVISELIGRVEVLEANNS